MGVPTYSGFIHASMVQSLLQLHKPLPTAVMVVERQRIDKARNAMAKACLEQGFDYLFFVDDDNPIPPDTLEKFLEVDNDIVSCPILARNPTAEGKYKLCSFYAKETQVDGKPLKLYSHIEVFKEEGHLHKVDATGMGACLIKREVLEAVSNAHKQEPFEWGDYKFEKGVTVDGVYYDRRTMGEDVEFCERATDLGFEVWLDERIKPVHISGLRTVKWGNGSG